MRQIILTLLLVALPWTVEAGGPCERQFWLDETKTDRVSSDSLEYVREVTTRRWYRVIGKVFEGNCPIVDTFLVYYNSPQYRQVIEVEQIRGEVIKIDTLEIWRKSVRVWPGPSKKDTTAFILPFPIDSVEIWENDIDSGGNLFDDLIGETIRDSTEVYWDTGDFKPPMPGKLIVCSVKVVDSAVWFDTLDLFKPNDTTVFDLPYLQWKDQFGRTWELVADSTPIWNNLYKDNRTLGYMEPKIIGWEPKLVFRLVEEE